MSSTLPTAESESLKSPSSEQSASEKIRSLKQLVKTDGGSQQTLLDTARNDADQKVRLYAIGELTELDGLIQIRTRSTLPDYSDSDIKAMQEQARTQYCRVLAASTKSTNSEKTRVEHIRILNLTDTMEVANFAKCKAAGTTAVDLVSEEGNLAELVLSANSAHVRKAALGKIHNQNLLLELKSKISATDKTVLSLVNKLISQSSDPSAEPASKKADTEKSIPSNPGEKSTSKKADTQKPTPTKKQDALTPTKESSKPKDSEKLVSVASIKKEITKLENESQRISHKNTDRLNTLRSNINRIQKSYDKIKESAESKDGEAGKTIALLYQKSSELLEKNHTHQEQLKLATEDLLEILKKALEDGQSHDALPAWDKIQGKISNTSGKIRAGLQKRANEYKTKLNELRDWKIFAATEKKKELIKQMQHLCDSKMHAVDRSKHISVAHKEWKSLGRSNQNEELWQEFKKLSDLAYEPCKEHFKKRKQQMSSNLQKRREICDQLEKALEGINSEGLIISDINKLLADTEKEWKIYAPIEQSKVRTLQKRYYLCINQFRKLRRNALRDNSKKKKDLIEKARIFSEMEDNNQAMAEVKLLQQEWRKVGPTSYKEDKKHWDNFKAACDKVFAKRNSRNAENRETLEKAEGDLKAIINSLDDVFRLDDDEFRKSRNNYQELMQRFSVAMDPKIKKQRSRLLDQFNAIKNKIDGRFKSLPNKKQQFIKNALRAKSQFLETLEKKLFGSKDDQQFVEIKNELDTEAWKEIESSGISEYEDVLHERLEKLVSAKSVKELESLAQQCEEQVRNLCIGLEIRANIDTPIEDQQLRMQLQLDQLKNEFGKSKPDRADDVRYAMDVELRSLCIGPLHEVAQKEFENRVGGAIKKLI